jgi:hypothetical protein
MSQIFIQKNWDIKYPEYNSIFFIQLYYFYKHIKDVVYIKKIYVYVELLKVLYYLKSF